MPPGSGWLLQGKVLVAGAGGCFGDKDFTEPRGGPGAAARAGAIPWDPATCRTRLDQVGQGTADALGGMSCSCVQQSRGITRFFAANLGKEKFGF